jgi:hypothetical protein
MKATAYFFDDNGLRGTFIAGVILPLCVVPFYLLYKNIYFALLAGFTLASFIALYHFATLLECISFFAGLGLLLFTSMMLMQPKKCNIVSVIVGIITCILCGVIGYLLNKNFLGPFADRKGNLTYFYQDVGSYIFLIPFAACYVYLFFYICA